MSDLNRTSHFFSVNSHIDLGPFVLKTCRRVNCNAGKSRQSRDFRSFSFLTYGCRHGTDRRTDGRTDRRDTVHNAAS